MEKKMNEIKKNDNDNESELIVFLQKNYAWIATFTTGATIIITLILNFISYLQVSSYFAYFGLNMAFADYKDMGLVYETCFSFLLLICFYVTCYSLINIGKNFKFDRIKYLLFDGILIIASNAIICITNYFNVPSSSRLVNFLILLFLEITLGFFMNIIIKNDVKSSKKSSDFPILYIKIFPFLIVLLIFSSIITMQLNYYNKKEFRIIDDDKVILYSTSEYYIISNCKIDNEEITIETNRQEKISTLNIKTETKKFGKVIRK